MEAAIYYRYCCLCLSIPFLMKTILLIASLLILSQTKVSSQNQLKRYDVRSGIIEYSITISGGIMGGKVVGDGNEQLYFKDFGAVEMRVEQSESSTTVKFFGREKTETTQTHTMSKLDNGESYQADLIKQTTYASRSQTMDAFRETNTDAGEAGRNILESMGGKLLGTETYQGYSCEIWELMGGKQWIYKGVMLKMDMTAMGIRTLKEATHIAFDIKVPEQKFELPDFPVQKADNYLTNDQFDAEMEEAAPDIEYMKNLSFEEWKTLVQQNDPEMQGKNDEELRESYNMMQQLLKMNNR